MIEVEGKINYQPIVILIDSGDSHIYLDPKMMERFQFSRSKLGKPWLVQLATGEKRKINEMVKACPMEMNGMRTKVDLNIIPLGSYDFLICMDWLD
jgi:predicted aspartyl protease